MINNTPPWLDWTKRLQAIAQNGLTYARDPFDVERYAAVREIAAEMLAAGSGTGIKVIRELISRDTGHATPKVDLRGAIFRGDELLLVKERSDGRWTLPGGWADPCESPSEGVVREVFEESGFRVRARRLAAVYDRSRHAHEPPFPFHIYKLFILCEIIGGEAAPSIETAEVAFFAEAQMPELSITRVTPGQVHRMFEHHRNPALPVDLD